LFPRSMLRRGDEEGWDRSARCALRSLDSGPGGTRHVSFQGGSRRIHARGSGADVGEGGTFGAGFGKQRLKGRAGAPLRARARPNLGNATLSAQGEMAAIMCRLSRAWKKGAAKGDPDATIAAYPGARSHSPGTAYGRPTGWWGRADVAQAERTRTAKLRNARATRPRTSSASRSAFRGMRIRGGWWGAKNPFELHAGRTRHGLWNRNVPEVPLRCCPRGLLERQARLFADRPTSRVWAARGQARSAPARGILPHGRSIG